MSGNETSESLRTDTDTEHGSDGPQSALKRELEEAAFHAKTSVHLLVLSFSFTRLEKEHER